MKISASSSGGFAGLHEHYEIDTQTHPAGHTLEAALSNSGFFNDSQAAEATVGADMVQWRITVEAPETPETRRTISFAEDGSAQYSRWQNLLAQIRAAS